MTKRQNFSIDWLVILLSTDWFFEYWIILGVDMLETKKVLLKQDCREILAQIMKISDGNNYYNTNFSENRVTETLQLFRDAVGDEKLFEQLSRLLGRIDLDAGSRWLLKMVTDDIVRGNSAIAELDPTITAVISANWKEGALDSEEIQSRSLESGTDWDAYIRALTPDLPTRLADFLIVEIGVSDFDIFWVDVCKVLTIAGKRELIDYYARAVFEMSGQQLDLSILH